MLLLISWSHKALVSCVEMQPARLKHVGSVACVIAVFSRWMWEFLKENLKCKNLCGHPQLFILDFELVVISPKHWSVSYLHIFNILKHTHKLEKIFLTAWKNDWLWSVSLINSNIMGNSRCSDNILILAGCSLVNLCTLVCVWDSVPSLIIGSQHWILLHCKFLKQRKKINFAVATVLLCSQSISQQTEAAKCFI